MWYGVIGILDDNVTLLRQLGPGERAEQQADLPRQTRVPPGRSRSFAVHQRDL